TPGRPAGVPGGSNLGQQGPGRIEIASSREVGRASRRSILAIAFDQVIKGEHRPRREARIPAINVAEAKAKLSQLLDRASAGEEIVISRAGKPVARLMALDVVEPRKPGAWRGWKASADALLASMDGEDFDAAEGKCTDELGISFAALRP